MAKAKAVAAVKIKKKAWYPILAPKELDNMVLGETYVTEPAAALGRIVHANLKNITDNMRDQNVYLKFKITSAPGNNLTTEIVGCYMTPSSIKKLTRRTASRMDESFVVVTQDGKRVRIKPVALTAYKTVRSVCSALRKAMKEQMAREVVKLSFIQLVENIVSHQLQNDVKKHISKIYPVKTIEIKVLEFAHEGKAVKVTEEKGEQKEEGAAAEQSVEEKPKKKSQKKKTVSEEMQEELAGSEEAEEETSGEAVERAQPAAKEEESESFGEEGA